MFECENCGNPIEEGSENVYCGKCLDEVVKECDCCGGLLPYDVLTEDGRYFCGDCVLDDRVITCDKCGEYFEAHHALFGEFDNETGTGDVFCEHCFHNKDWED